MKDQIRTSGKLWWRLNRKSLPFVLILPVLLVLVNIVLLFQGAAPSETFNTESLLGIFEFIWIPLFTINMVYMAGVLAARTTFGFGRQMLLKLFFCAVGVLFATWVVEIIYAGNGIYDDDILVLGDITIPPGATNYVTNAVVAIAIAAPVLLNQERKRRLENKLEARRLELEKLEKLQVQSRLEALQARLNPHFLYNALNTLVNLVHTDPARAEKVILGMSELFRYNLQKDERQFVSLEEELKMVETYLSIETIRFEGMLEYTIEVNETLLQQPMPRSLLQPLVENAVKHGTSQHAKGWIKIRIGTDEKAYLQINVSDNGPPFPKEPELGFGLGSTIEKLDLLFPGNYELNWTNSPVKSVNIVLKRRPDEPG